MNNILRILILTASFSAVLRGDSPISPHSFMVVPSRSGSSTYLVMVPIYDTTTGNAASGFARCYAIDDDGKSVFKWEVRGWYDFPRSLYLNADGSGLVRVHDIGKADPRDPIGMPDKKKLNNENYRKIILLSFYYKGKLVKDVRLDEVVTNFDSKVEYGSPYYPIVRSVNFLPLRQVYAQYAIPEPKDMSEDEKRSAEAVSIVTDENEELFFRVSDGSLLHRHTSDSKEDEK